MSLSNTQKVLINAENEFTGKVEALKTTLTGDLRVSVVHSGDDDGEANAVNQVKIIKNLSINNTDLDDGSGIGKFFGDAGGTIDSTLTGTINAPRVINMTLDDDNLNKRGLPLKSTSTPSLTQNYASINGIYAKTDSAETFDSCLLDPYGDLRVRNPLNPIVLADGLQIAQNVQIQGSFTDSGLSNLRTLSCDTNGNLNVDNVDTKKGLTTASLVRATDERQQSYVFGDNGATNESLQLDATNANSLKVIDNGVLIDEARMTPPPETTKSHINYLGLHDTTDNVVRVARCDLLSNLKTTDVDYNASLGFADSTISTGVNRSINFPFGFNGTTAQILQQDSTKANALKTNDESLKEALAQGSTAPTTTKGVRLVGNSNIGLTGTETNVCVDTDGHLSVDIIGTHTAPLPTLTNGQKESLQLSQDGRLYTQNYSQDRAVPNANAIPEDTVLATVGVLAHDATNATARYLEVDATGSLLVSPTKGLYDTVNTSPADTEVLQKVALTLHDNTNSLLKTAKCNEFGEQIIDDYRGRMGLTTGTNPSQTLTATIKEFKQILMAGADSPTSATAVNQSVVDSQGALNVRLNNSEDRIDGGLATTKPLTDTFPIGVSLLHNTVGSNMMVAQCDNSGHQYISIQGGTTLKQTQSQFVSYTTSHNLAGAGQHFIPKNNTPNVGNDYGWYKVNNVSNYSKLFLIVELPQTANTNTITPYTYTGTNPLLNPNGVPLIDYLLGGNIQDFITIDIVWEDAPIDTSALSFGDVVGRVAHHQQFILTKHTNSAGTESYSGSIQVPILQQYFMPYLHCQGTSIATSPIQIVRYAFNVL
jgi:hypothetical protein